MKNLIILLCVIFLSVSCQEDPKDIKKDQISAEYYELLENNSLVKIKNSKNRYYLKTGESIKEIADISNTDIVTYMSKGDLVIVFSVFIFSGISFAFSIISSD